MSGPGQLKRSQSTPAAVQQKSSTFHGSSSFSFGRQAHQRGKFKIPVLDPRSVEYVPGANGNPSVGTYNLDSTMARHDRIRGHPAHHRTPGYCFGASTEKRKLSADEVKPPKSCGPGSYLGHEHHVVMRSTMSYTMRPRCGDGGAFGRPGGVPGPNHYMTSHSQDLLQSTRPPISFGKQERKTERYIGDMTINVGPGQYNHITAMHT